MSGTMPTSIGAGSPQQVMSVVVGWVTDVSSY